MHGAASTDGWSFIWTLLQKELFFFLLSFLSYTVCKKEIKKAEEFVGSMFPQRDFSFSWSSTFVRLAPLPKPLFGVFVAQFLSKQLVPPEISIGNDYLLLNSCRVIGKMWGELNGSLQQLEELIQWRGLIASILWPIHNPFLGNR